MVNVVELSEQKGHAEKNIWELHGSLLNYGTISPGEITVPNIRENKTCLKYRLNDGHLEYQSSYFIGLDWLVRDKLACFVRPKMDDGLSQVDYCSMLINAIENVKNQDYLSDLVHIKFDEPFVEIEQKDDALSPFLAIQFLSLLQKIVRKGLKKSYYMVDENLNSRIKGKLLVSQDLKINRLKGSGVKAMCRYQYYGVDTEENRILKKAFVFACHVIDKCHLQKDMKLQNIIMYVRPAFDGVSDTIEIQRVKHFATNKIYKEYNQGLQYAMLLLRRFGYSIKPMLRNGKQVVMTPPYWIDMSKLFELYVYQQLCSLFPDADVRYHIRLERQELDILFNDNKTMKFVIDAKYKPNYSNSNILKDDIRQVCGYSRLKEVYEILDMKTTEIIPAIIIYPTLNDSDLSKENFRDSLVSDDRYVNLYKLGIKIPQESACL